jgi:hypothetical protein
MPDFFKMITSNDTVKILFVLFAIYLLITFVNKKSEKMDNTDIYMVPEQMENEEEVYEQMENEEEVYEELENVSAGVVQPIETKEYTKVVGSTNSEKISAGDLLPKYDDANAFAKENPVSKLLKEQNFLISGYHVGINTVMQSNKIPYQDIRSLPPIPKENVGPWNQSSYEQSPAQMRRFFEIGQ